MLALGKVIHGRVEVVVNFDVAEQVLAIAVILVND